MHVVAVDVPLLIGPDILDCRKVDVPKADNGIDTMHVTWKMPVTPNIGNIYIILRSYVHLLTKKNVNREVAEALLPILCWKALDPPHQSSFEQS